MVKRYKEDAMLEAAARADQLQEDGDWQGALYGIASWTALSASRRRNRPRGRRSTE